MKRLNPLTTRLGYITNWPGSTKMTNSVVGKRFVLLLEMYAQKKITQTQRMSFRRRFRFVRSLNYNRLIRKRLALRKLKKRGRRILRRFFLRHKHFSLVSNRRGVVNSVSSTPGVKGLFKKSFIHPSFTLYTKRQFATVFRRKVKRRWKFRTRLLKKKNYAALRLNKFYASIPRWSSRFLSFRRLVFSLLVKKMFLKKKNLSRGVFFRSRRLVLRRLQNFVKLIKMRRSVRRSRSIKIVRKRVVLRRRESLISLILFYRVRATRGWNRQLWQKRFRKKFIKKPRRKFTKKRFKRKRKRTNRRRPRLWRKRKRVVLKRLKFFFFNLKKRFGGIPTNSIRIFRHKGRFLFSKNNRVFKKFKRRKLPLRRKRKFRFYRKRWRRKKKKRIKKKKIKPRKRIFRRFRRVIRRRKKKFRKLLRPFIRNFKYRCLVSQFGIKVNSSGVSISVEDRNVQPLLFSNIRFLRVFYQLSVYKKLTNFFYPRKFSYSFFSTTIQLAFQWRNIFLLTSSLALEFRRTRYHYRFFKIFGRFLKVIIAPQYTLLNLVIRVRGCFGKIARTRPLFLRPLSRHHIPDNLSRVYQPVIFSFKHVRTSRGVFSFAVWLS